MTIALIGTPKRCSAFALDRERRSSRPAPSPPSTTCLENFSLPGLLIVTTHFDLLNSSEANKVVSFARAVVATLVAEVTDCIGCLHAGVEAQPTNSTVSRRSSVGWSLWHRWSSWEGLATRAAQEGSSQRDRELSSDCRDRVFEMPFGSDRRRRGVWDGWICEMFGAAGGLRGESPLVRG